MKPLQLLTILLVVLFNTSRSQNVTGTLNHPIFPQKEINAEMDKAFEKPAGKIVTAANAVKPDANSSAYRAINKINELKNINWEKYTHGGNTSRVLDTVYVGVVPHDTLWITGTYNHTGPIFVFNDGVLIFLNATATNNGDLIVFQHGRVIGLSSTLIFPQQYFYQRSILVVQHGLAYFRDCSFNYSGMQHGLTITDSASVGMEHVHQNDWTTAGLSGHATLQIHGLNLGGEYILTDSSTSVFSNVDTLLLWHKLPKTAVVNYAFPKGDTVYNYHFNNTISGIGGINYNVTTDSCYNVWWGLMPVNGSDATFSNSKIRAIGAWFERGDTATVTGIYDNTHYANTVAPMTDRNLHLINTDVQTWSLYVFDTSKINISNCTLGEVGTQQKASILSQQFLLDGSGGYFWATDTSAIFASNVTVYSTARSEHNGIFVLSYSNLPFSTPSSINQSLFVSVQNALPADPLPYDASIMWLENIESPSTAHADSLIQVKGSEWIDQGPQGSWMDYGKYSLYYQLQGATSWKKIVRDSVKEIRHNVLGVWNTNGLVAGTYILRLVVKNNLTDSVEDFKAVTILPGIVTGLKENNDLSLAIFPNPAVDHLELYLSENNSAAEIKIYNLLGEIKYSSIIKGSHANIDVENFTTGVYFVEVKTGNKISWQKFIKK